MRTTWFWGDTIFDLAAKEGSAADLIGAAVPSNNQDVAPKHLPPLKLTGQNLKIPGDGLSQSYFGERGPP